MKVLLVQPPLMKADKFLSVPLSLLSIGTEIKHCGNDVQILDLNYEAHRAGRIFDQLSVDLLHNVMRSFSPDVVGFTAYCTNIPLAIYLSRCIKKSWKNTKIIIGGPHASSVARPLLDSVPEIDAVVVGEGEMTCREMFSSNVLNFVDVKGLLYRSSRGTLCDNGHRDLVEDLDDLRDIDYSLIDMRSYIDRSGIMYNASFYEIGRGCPFKCKFCSASMLWGHKYRVKSVKRVVSEIDKLQREHGIECYDFVHDHLFFQPRYIESLANEIIRCGLKIRWSCTTRADDFDQSLIGLIKRSGCYRVLMGIETGTSRMQEVVGKSIDLDDACNVMNKCIESGLQVAASFIIGFPEELIEDYEETLKLALKYRLAGCNALQIHKYMPHPGTPLYEQHKDTIQACSYESHLWPWDESKMPLMHEISANTGIYASFCHLETGSGDEKFLLDSEFLFYILINKAPKTLFYLIHRAGIAFEEIAQRFDVIKPEYGRRYTVTYEELETIINNIVQIFEKRIPYIDALLAIIKYELVIQSLQFQAAEKANSMQNKHKTKGLDYRRNELIDLHRLRYDMTSLFKAVETDENVESAKANSASSYLFVYWMGSVHVYCMSNEMIKYMDMLDTEGEKDSYFVMLGKVGCPHVKNEGVYNTFVNSHVIIEY